MLERVAATVESRGTMRKPRAKSRAEKAERVPADGLMSALASATSHAEHLRTLLARLDLQKAVLDQHAVVSECDVNGCFTYVNDALCRLSGYAREELLGKPHSIINSDYHSPAFWMSMYEAVSKGGVWQSEVCNRAKDGSEFWLMQTIAAVRDDEGRLVAYVDVGADISETKRLQSEIVRRGRLAQLGQLTATVAHEIRNPLGAVRTAAFVVERRIRGYNEKSGKPAAEWLDVSAQMQRICNGVARCDRIISELLDFARSKAVSVKLVAVDDWLRGTVEEEARNLPALVEVKLDLGLGQMTASIDADQMRRAVINLVSNASEAMVGRSGDPAAVMTSNPVIRVSTAEAGGWIEIRVADNGPGIAPEILSRIREPLFTTKSFGIGLGVPAVEKIIESHGGALGIESTLGQGTVCTVRFPREQGQRTAA